MNFYCTWVGTDVEVFLQGPDGTIIPSDHHLPLKNKALLVPWQGKTTPQGRGSKTSSIPYSALHVDGIQAELTVAPHSCRSYIMDWLRNGLQHMYMMGKEKGFELCVDSTVDTPAELLAQASPAGVAFGCDPDFLAWEGNNINFNDIYPPEHYRRYAGVHIHVSSTTSMAVENLVHLMDIFLGCPMVLIERDDPTVAIRRSVFGKAGVFRPTAYGFEYRVPSAHLLKHPYLMHFALGIGSLVETLARNNMYDDIVAMLNHDNTPILAAINHNDPEAAYWVVEKVWNVFRSVRYLRSAIDVYAAAIHDPTTIFGGSLADNWLLDVQEESVHSCTVNSDMSLPLDDYLFDVYGRNDLEKPTF